MSVAVLLITHENIANHILSTAQSIFKSTFENLVSIEIPMDISCETAIKNINNKITALNTKDGILVITDLVGSTPFNVATHIKNSQPNARLITGLNLPMLLKLYNYRQLALADLTKRVMTGGQNGIYEF